MAKRSSRKTKTEAPVATSNDPNVQPYLGALNNLANGDKAVGRGLAGGAELGSLLGYTSGGLGRVDESFDPAMQELYNRVKAESFLGGHQQSDEVTNALSNMQATSNRAQQFDPTLSSILEQRNQQYQQAGQVDPMIQELIQLRKNNLGGYSTPEMVAMQEQAQSGLNQSLDTGLRALRMGQAAGGPRGAASNIGAVPLTAQFANAQQNLQRQLILDNYNAKQVALDKYGGLIQDVDKNKFDRQQQTLNSYSNDANQFNNDFINNQVVANNSFSTAAQNANQFAIKDRADRLNNFINFTGNLRNDLYNRHLENLNRIAAEKSGFLTTTLGGGAFAGEQQGRRDAYDLGLKNIDAQKALFEGGGGTEWSSGNSGGGSGSDSFA